MPKKSGDEVICITLSSALSGTYQSAMLAKNMADYNEIYVIDSLTATLAIHIMIEHARKMIANGLSAAEIAQSLEELKGKTRIFACVDTLKYLYLGGRVSRTTAIIADTVNIKPCINVSAEGKVEVVGKYLGVSRAVRDLVKRLPINNINTDLPFYIVYSYDPTNALKLKNAVEAAGVRVDSMFELGSTLGVHVGPGAFGTIYAER